MDCYADHCFWYFFFSFRNYSFFNKGVITEIKKKLREKNSDIKKMEKMVHAMKEVGFPVDHSVMKKISDTRSQVANLEKQLPEK